MTSGGESFTDTCWLTATEALVRIADGSLTAIDLLEACLARIEDRESDVQAWAHLDADRARVAARGVRPGPLSGIPVGVKDVFDTADQPTAYGYAAYEGFRPCRDAAVVTRLRAAGAIVVGKTVTTEFAFKCPSVTRNPHNLGHTPAGSSSGSAAAVADGMVPLAVGTQTGGSVILPAAYCGVVGYKPSFGWVPRAGCLTISESVDTPGVFARTIGDGALLAEVLTGRDLLPDASVMETPVFGLDRTPQWEELEPIVRKVIEDAIDALRASGAQVEEIDAVDDNALGAPQATIVAYEAVRGLAHEWELERDHLSSILRDRLALGATIHVDTYDEALATVRGAKEDAHRTLAGFDAVLTPSVLGPAPRDLTTIGSGACCRVWTLLGVPSLHLPLGLDKDDLPVGVQMVAAYGRDRQLLAAAHWAAERLEVSPAPRPAPVHRLTSSL